MNELDEPLIWTIKGNMPLAQLRYETEWTVTDEFIKFVEKHIDSSGEVVKQSSHVYDRVGVSARLFSAKLGE